MEKTQLIFKKVATVMEEIGPIAKDRKNTQQGYSFRGIDELMNALAPIAAKNNIFPATTSIENVLCEPVTSKSGSAGTHLIRRYTFRFYAEDGSFVDTVADGEAIDYGDKASNKAYSVAYREAMFKLFIVPFENEDIENANHDLTASQASPKPRTEAKAVEPTKDADSALKAAKDRTVSLLKLLGHDLKTKKQYEDKVFDLTGLQLVEANFDDINERLSTLLDERNQPRN